MKQRGEAGERQRYVRKQDPKVKESHYRILRLEMTGQK